MFGKLHFHILWPDGVYEERTASNGESLAPRLRRTRAPTSAQLTQLADTIARRVCRHLAKRGWLEGEEDSAFLTDSAGGDDGLDALRMSSIGIVGMKRRLGLHGTVVAESPHTYQRAHRSRTGRTPGGQPPWRL